MVMSCRISSYFSSMDKVEFSLVQFLELPVQLLLALPEGRKRRVGHLRPLLEPVDVILDRRQFPFHSQPTQCTHAVVGGCRRGFVRRCPVEEGPFSFT